MKTQKLILVTVMFIGGVFQLLAQDIYNWDATTGKYKNEEYTIKYNGFIYMVTNNKYELSNKKIGVDANYDYETIDDHNKRRESLRWTIYNALDEVFHFRSIPVPYDDLIRLSVECYFDSKTKDYVGVYFMFPPELKDYMTLQRINQAEKKLLECKINAGETCLLDDRPYFSISVSTRVGK